MFVQEEFIAINTTPAVVEKHLTNAALQEKWRSALVVIEPIEGDFMVQGSTFMLCLKSLGLAGVKHTVTERDNKHILLTSDGLWRGTEVWQWFADGSRTIVQHRVEYEAPNIVLNLFMTVAGSLLVQLDMRIQLLRLQQAIEGRTPAQITTAKDA